MQQSSQWVFQGNDKRLDMANPVCVGMCPGTYNTSTRCWLPLNQTYAWVQDYPTQAFIGMLCRPSRKFTQSLSDQAWFFGLLTALLLGACFWRVLSADAQQRVPFEAQCFFEGEAGSIDRSDTTISLLHQDWSSHELVTYVAAFILKEWLGYNVELVRLKEMANSEEYRRRLETMREGVWDADLESWLLIMERQHREDMLTVVEPLQPIGYSGRSGLYVMPQVLEQDKFADWWKFYLQPGHGWPTFCFVKQLGSLPLPRRLDNCDKRSFEAVQEVGRAQIQRIPLKCHFITTAFS
eukprot:g11315.t1